MKKARIAKIIARRTSFSRRDVEKLIIKKQIKVNGVLIDHPSYQTAMDDETIMIDNKKIPKLEAREIWLFHKPKGCLVTKYDPKSRKTVFDYLPKNLSYLIAIGRLDYNTEGLLLFTNDGEFARDMELPSSNIQRIYNCKVIGRISEKKLLALRGKQNINNITYHVDNISILDKTEKYFWVQITLKEGKNREVRNLFTYVNLIVKRLIRIQYGKYTLDDLKQKSILKIS